MSSKNYLFTSEWVSPGHPDKLMDTIAEAIVDYAIDNDSKARVAVDGVVKNNRLILAGEITCAVEIPFEKIVKDVLYEIGYTPDKVPGFNYENVQVETIFSYQSPDINMGVDKNNGIAQGAGDQGIMYGGAVREARDFTPHSYFLARHLGLLIYQSKFDWAKPDIKTQVTIRYENGVPVEIVDIVCAVSHTENVSLDFIRETVKNTCMKYITIYATAMHLKYDAIKWHINTTGRFVICGPESDSGEVGRKIVVDQAGAMNSVGGGNLNGKCPSKVDRTAVYQARQVAKWLVHAGVCDKCEIQVSYSIGETEPISVYINCFGTEKEPMSVIETVVKKAFSFKPADMVKNLRLTEKDRPFQYKYCGMYGHIGESVIWDYRTWEAIPDIDFYELI